MENKIKATKNKIVYLRHDELTEKIVAEKMKEIGLDQSKAIRMIIREWAEMKKQYITVPIKGFIDAAIDAAGVMRYIDDPAAQGD